MTLLDKKSDILDTKVPILTRIKFPRIWKRFDEGVQIEDLQEDKFDEALEHIKKCYITDETLCCLAKIADDNESIECYLKLIRWWMQDTQSLVAVLQETGKVIGVLVTRVHDLYLMKTLSRVMDYNGEPLKKMQKFSVYINKAIDVNKTFDVENYNQIYIWSVDKSYRNKGIGKGLLQACIEQTKSFKLKILIGVFTNIKTQLIARNEGFYSLYELPYNNWKSKAPVVFRDISMKNHSAKVMALNLENCQYGNRYDEIMEKFNISGLFTMKSVRNNTKDTD